MKVKAVQDLPIGDLCGPFAPWKTTLSGSPTSCLTSLHQPTTPPRKGLAWARLRQLECLMCEAEIVSPPLLSVLVENKGFSRLGRREHNLVSACARAWIGPPPLAKLLVDQK